VTGHFSTFAVVIVSPIGNSPPHVMATGADAGGGPHVKVFDAATGAIRASFYAYAPRFLGGVRVAVADVNGDGVPDIVTGAGPGGGPHVKVVDGRKLTQTLSSGAIDDAALLQSFYAFAADFHGGVSVAAGDTNGDRHADVIVGAGQTGGPQVKIFDGA